MPNDSGEGEPVPAQKGITKNLIGPSVDIKKLIGPKINVGNLIGPSIDIKKLIGPKINVGNLIGPSIDIDKLIGPKINVGNLIGPSIDIDKLIGPKINVGNLIGKSIDFPKLTQAFDITAVSRASELLNVETFAAAAEAAARTTDLLDRRDLEQLDESVLRGLQDEDGLRQLPDALLELGREGLAALDAESVEGVEAALEQPEDSHRGLKVAGSTALCLLWGAWILLSIVHNSKAAAEDPEASRFVEAFFAQLSFYVSVAVLMLAIRDSD